MLHEGINRFQYRICEQGHVIYSSSGPVLDQFCRICGSPFVVRCSKCDKVLPDVFSSPVYLTNGEPVHLPGKPGACTNCGNVFPWVSRGVDRPEMTEAETLGLVCRICRRFHRVACQLRQRREGRPTLDVRDEYDVQDLLHSLLRLHFDDIRAEEWTPTYAGGAARMDFLLKDHRIVIEAKKTRCGLGSREVGKQLIEDIAKYRQSHDCRKLVCFIYDPDGTLVNRDGLIRDLEGLDTDIEVKVIVAPAG